VSRVVVVTGGAKGIGLAVVRRLAALGDDVVALGRDRDALARAGVRVAVCDVTDEYQVAATFSEIGCVDVLINNAGIAQSAPLERTSTELWHAHLDVNVTGAFFCLRAVTPGMLARGSGAVVNVASTAGRVGTPYTAAYTASKHALIGLTRAAAAELGPSGLRVNAVCPAYVATELTERSVQRIVESTGRDEESARAALADASPLGRLLTPDEVADTIVWLASDAAAAINGQAIVIDGGGVQA
jgi:NAD(P)-dependent dehydrogenase (short-subunit alcohol dehydrogenase family)